MKTKCWIFSSPAGIVVPVATGDEDVVEAGVVVGGVAVGLDTGVEAGLDEQLKRNRLMINATRKGTAICLNCNLI